MTEKTKVPETPAAAPAFDMDALTRSITEAVNLAVDARTEAPVAPAATPAVVPQEQRSATDRQEAPKVTGQRDTDGPDGVNIQTHRMLKQIALRNDQGRRDVQAHMERAGMYEGAAWGEQMGEKRAISLTSSEGAAFLPTSVDNRIEEIREQFGAMRQVCNVFNFSSGSHKIPNTSGRPKVFAVNEGSDIKMRKATWGSVTLDPLKWGLIRSYSSEMNDEIGSQWVSKVTDQVGRSFAEMEDETVLIADGTATYHSLDGIIAALASVVQYTMSAGNTSFNDWTYSDGIEAMKVSPAGNRNTGTHVLHPDMQLVMATFADPGNAYLYPVNEEPTRLVRPVVYTEAMPAIGADAISTNFHAFGDFSFVTMGFQRGVDVKLLDQATILDTDDSTAIRLGSTDALALRFTSRWDVKIGLAAAFTKSRTAAA